MESSSEIIKPQQKRSIKRFEKVLETAEYILTSGSNYSLTIQDVAKISGMKRPSIYKFFPSNESIVDALSEKHCLKLLGLIKKNLKNVNYSNVSEHYKIVIDVSAIYINQNKEIAEVLFTKFAENLLTKAISEEISKLSPNTKPIKNLITTQMLISSLYSGYKSEKSISPAFLGESKRACLSYLAN
jgi:AcrR family transcriptional regulator|tara:strand:+ start:1845 stop:2402 length:558 start_codon:yes stop_codon:yes gene_type:complete